MGWLLKKVFKENNALEIAIGRLGGDEFAVYIGCKKGNQQQTILYLMDNILDEFDLEFTKEKKTLPLSLSGGLVMEEGNEESYSKLYMKADSALYKAKESGKHQYNVYKEDDADEV